MAPPRSEAFVLVGLRGFVCCVVLCGMLLWMLCCVLWCCAVFGCAVLSCFLLLCLVGLSPEGKRKGKGKRALRDGFGSQN